MPAVVQICSEFERIDALPRRTITEADDDELRRFFDARLAKPSTQCVDRDLPCPLGLNRLQARSLAESLACGGLVAPMAAGSGKTLLSLLLPTVHGSKRPVLIVPAGLRDATRLEWAHLAKHWHVASNLSIVAYQQLSLVSYNDWLDQVEPDLMILDECFDAGTLVETIDGARPIETLAPGDYVISSDGSPQRVEKVMARESDLHLDFVLSGHRIKTTPNHPILTERGWVAAGDLTPRDFVRILQRIEVAEEPFLRQELLCEMARSELSGAHGEPGDAREGRSDASGEPSTGPLGEVVGAHAGEEPDARRRDTRARGGEVTRHRASPEDAGRQRHADAGSASDTSSGARAWVGGRASAAGRQGLGQALDDRHRAPGNEASDRGRRSESQAARSAAVGPRKGRTAYLPGLARVALVERRSGAARSVYNLTVEGSSTYVLSESGAIVHNCHKAKNPSAAVSRKIAGYVSAARAAGRPLVVAIMSGTLSRTGALRDHAALQRFALGAGAPVPLRAPVVASWAPALGEGEGDELLIDDQGRSWAGALEAWIPERRELVKPIVEGGFGLTAGEAAGPTRAAVRVGVRERILSTPGVVGSREAACDATLSIDAWCPDVPSEVAKACASLEASGEMPDGQSCGDALEIYRHTSTLALGFWDRWRTQPPPIWRQARRLWHNFVRRTLAHSKRIHSTLDVANAVDRGDLTDPEILAYATRHEIQDLEALLTVARGSPEPLRVLATYRFLEPTFKPASGPVWFDTALVDAMCAWLAKPGILWVSSRALGAALAGRGFAYFGAGGLDQRKRAIGDARGTEPIVASVDANGTGRNLQAWSRNLVVQPDPDAVVWEQLLARTHRPGQRSDEVTCELAMFDLGHAKMFRRARMRAVALQQSWGAPQRLVTATYSDRFVSALASFDDS